ncbi:peptidase S41, partial [Luminiphilus sp.]|nr:peptidase S41 [Luminiphilus sp.]
PDVVVERARLTSLEQGQRLREADLNGSLVNEGVEQEVETEVIASLREEDNQLYEAFTLLKGINVYRDLNDKAGSTVSLEAPETQATETGVSTN